MECCYKSLTNSFSNVLSTSKQCKESFFQKACRSNRGVHRRSNRCINQLFPAKLPNPCFKCFVKFVLLFLDGLIVPSKFFPYISNSCKLINVPLDAFSAAFFVKGFFNILIKFIPALLHRSVGALNSNFVNIFPIFKRNADCRPHLISDAIKLILDSFVIIYNTVENGLHFDCYIVKKRSDVLKPAKV